jgi:hypothetical protein
MVYYVRHIALLKHSRPSSCFRYVAALLCNDPFIANTRKQMKPHLTMNTFKRTHRLDSYVTFQQVINRRRQGFAACILHHLSLNKFNISSLLHHSSKAQLFWALLVHRVGCMIVAGSVRFLSASTLNTTTSPQGIYSTFSGLQAEQTYMPCHNQQQDTDRKAISPWGSDAL